MRYIALFALALFLLPIRAAEPDPKVMSYTLPDKINWVRNAAGTNEQAILFGDPSKPGPYVVRLKWLPGNMSRPHYHANDRFFIVISGTWWMGTGEKFDPEGSYIRTWVPELERLPAPYIHRPWEAPAGVLAMAGVELGKNYPRPIVEHDMARKRALEALATLKE